MRVLVTAFDPFVGMDTNASMMTLEKIKDKIDENIEIIKLVVPTVYNECANVAWDTAIKENADVILSLGQAGGRSAVTVEVIGINYAHAQLGDNMGNVKCGEKLFENSEAALFSTLPVKAMVERAKECGFKADLSVSAGGFVCNSLLYTLLKNAEDTKKSIRVGFVHLPYEAGQGKEGFCMKDSDMALCVEEMIRAIKNSERI